MLARWGYRFLLEADNVSEIYRQRYSDAGPDFPDCSEILLAGFEVFHLIWREAGRDAALKHPVAALIEGYLSRLGPDTRDTGIMPAPLAAHRHIETTADTGFLFDVTKYDRAPQTGEILTNDKSAHLPGLSPRPSGAAHRAVASGSRGQARPRRSLWSAPVGRSDSLCPRERTLRQAHRFDPLRANGQIAVQPLPS